MTQSPKWRTWILNLRDEIINEEHGIVKYRGSYAPQELDCVQVIELSAVKELVDALKRIASAESFVGYAFDGNHQFKSLFDEMVLRRKLAEDTLAKLPAEVL